MHKLSRTQQHRTEKTKIVDWTPTSPKDYFAVLESGLTKTRLVKSFSLLGLEVVLEVNSAQPCIVYARESNSAHSHKMLPLPGSEGHIDEKYGGVFARGGDLIMIDGTVYVVLANFNGNNKVYSFDGQWLIGQSFSPSSDPSLQPISTPSGTPFVAPSLREPSAQPSFV